MTAWRDTPGTRAENYGHRRCDGCAAAADRHEEALAAVESILVDARTLVTRMRHLTDALRRGES